MGSQGVEAVLTSALDWTDAVSTDFSFAFIYNDVNVTAQSDINGQKPVSASGVKDIENSCNP